METKSLQRHFSADASPEELDLRCLPSPLPMQYALAAAEALFPGQTVRVLTPLMPLPLLDMLATLGFSFEATRLPDGGARVLICRRPEGVHGDDQAIA